MSLPLPPIIDLPALSRTIILANSTCVYLSLVNIEHVKESVAVIATLLQVLFVALWPTIAMTFTKN